MKVISFYINEFVFEIFCSDDSWLDLDCNQRCDGTVWGQ